MSAEELLKDLMEIRKRLQEKYGEEDEEEEEHPIQDSLLEDMQDFLYWALGMGKEKCCISKTQGIKAWKKLHPDHELPRVFTSENGIKDELVVSCLMYDAFPLYLAHKKANK